MLLAKNRKAYYDSEILEKYTAGVQLYGYEVKAVKAGHVNFDGSYVQMLGNIPTLVNLYIGTYAKQSQKIAETELRRSRRLLLNKKEIEELQKDLKEKGRTAIPLALVLAHNMIKLEFGVARG